MATWTAGGLGASRRSTSSAATLSPSAAATTRRAPSLRPLTATCPADPPDLAAMGRARPWWVDASTTRWLDDIAGNFSEDFFAAGRNQPPLPTGIRDWTPPKGYQGVTMPRRKCPARAIQRPREARYEDSAGRPGRRTRADRPLRGSRVATGSAGPSRRAGRVSPAARAGSGAWFRTASRPDFVITTEKLKEIRESFPNYGVAEKQLLLLRHTHHAVVAEAEAGREGLLVVVVGHGRQRSTRLAGHVPSAATSWRVPSS